MWIPPPSSESIDFELVEIVVLVVAVDDDKTLRSLKQLHTDL